MQGMHESSYDDIDEDEDFPGASGDLGEGLIRDELRKVGNVDLTEPVALV